MRLARPFCGVLNPSMRATAQTQLSYLATPPTVITPPPAAMRV